MIVMIARMMMMMERMERIVMMIVMVMMVMMTIVASKLGWFQNASAKSIKATAHVLAPTGPRTSELRTSFLFGIFCLSM